jgi:hypothetical protein
MALSANAAIKGATTSRLLNRLAYDMANRATDITTAATGDIIPMIDISADYELKYGDAANVMELLGLTATAALLNAAAAGVRGVVTIADATPYAVLAANSGKTHLIAEQTSSITINLPVIAAGLEYKFVMGGVATEAQNWVFVATTPSFLNGGVAWTDLNDAESNLAVVYGNGSSHLTLTVTTPAAGTEINVYSNGTEWIAHGDVVSDSTPAFT